jgi:hypothetical protein
LVEAGAKSEDSEVAGKIGYRVVKPISESDLCERGGEVVCILIETGTEGEVSEEAWERII